LIGKAGLVALKRENHILVPLPDDLVVCARDVLAVVGTDAQLRSVEALCVGGAARRVSTRSTTESSG
jgi:hypothetical protein